MRSKKRFVYDGLCFSKLGVGTFVVASCNAGWFHVDLVVVMLFCSMPSAGLADKAMTVCFVLGVGSLVVAGYLSLLLLCCVLG